MPTFDTPDPISVTVEIGVGEIRIDAGARADTQVEIRPSDPSHPDDIAAAEQTRVEYAGGQLHVRGPKRRRARPAELWERVDRRGDRAARGL